MTRMIEDNAFRAEFEAFADENGYGICAGTDHYGDNTVETRDTVQDFIDVAGTKVVTDETRNDRRFVVLERGNKTIIVADHGEARLTYVG